MMISHLFLYNLWLAVWTVLKNDGIRQWEGWHPIYEMEKSKCSKPPTSIKLLSNVTQLKYWPQENLYELEWLPSRVPYVPWKIGEVFRLQLPAVTGNFWWCSHWDLRYPTPNGARLWPIYSWVTLNKKCGPPHKLGYNML